MDTRDKFLKSVNGNIVEIGNTLNKDEKLIADMSFECTEICVELFKNENLFNAEDFFNLLYKYLQSYRIVLFSVISNYLYRYFEKYTDEEELHTFISGIDSNLSKLISYINSNKFNERLNLSRSNSEEDDKTDSETVSEILSETLSSDVEISENKAEKESYIILLDTKNTILKIYDHIHIAQQQNQLFSRSNQGFKDTIHENITKEKDDLLKDMNSQLITLVSIFTAIAFLIFGGISSLNNIFQKMDMFVLDVLAVASVWGLCLINLLHVFLSSIEHMTQSKYDCEKNKNDCKRYTSKLGVYWWSNLVLIVILTICFSGQFFSYTDWMSSFNFVINPRYEKYVWLTIGFLYILLFIPVFKVVFEKAFFCIKCISDKRKRAKSSKPKHNNAKVSQDGNIMR